MKPNKTVTLCTDASYSHTHKVGAWACYIRTPDTTIKTGGLLKEFPPNVNDAEQRGMVNALHILINNLDISNYKLIIYCDNKHALGDILVTSRKKWTSGKERLQFYNSRIRPLLLQAAEYEARHVKGHVDKSKWQSNSARNYMNDWCDKHAKAILRAETTRIGNEAK